MVLKNRLNLCWSANEAAAWVVKDRKIVQLKSEHEYIIGNEVIYQNLLANTAAQKQEEMEVRV